MPLAAFEGYLLEHNLVGGEPQVVTITFHMTR